MTDLCRDTSVNMEGISQPVSPRDEFIVWVKKQGWSPVTKGIYIYWWNRWQDEFPGDPEKTYVKFLEACYNIPARNTVHNWFEFKGIDKKMPKIRGRMAKKLPKWLPFADIMEMVAYAKGNGYPREALFIQLLFETGLRVSEGCGIRPENIDWGSGYLVVPAGMEGNKGRREYPIKLRPSLLAAMKRYIEQHGRPEGASIFQLNRKLAHYYTARISKAALGRAVGPHVLRHSMGTFLIEKGMPIHEVMQRMRHQSLSTTGVYLHSNPRQTEDKVTALFDEAQADRKELKHDD